jgi:hypothetical protein
MRVLDFVLGIIIIVMIIMAVTNKKIKLPSQVVQKYEGCVITDKDNFYLSKWLTVATEDSSAYFVVSDLVYETYALGDTIK